MAPDHAAPTRKLRIWLIKLACVVLAAAIVAVIVALVINGSHPIVNDYDVWASKLNFASGVMAGCFLLFVAAMAAYLWGPAVQSPETEARGKMIFDGVKTSIPPIITMVLGFYFGAQTPEDKRNQADADKYAKVTARSESSLTKAPAPASASTPIGAPAVMPAAKPPKGCAPPENCAPEIAPPTR